MTQQQIKQFLTAYAPQKERTIVVIDFSNVERWKESLGWDIGIKELGQLMKSLTAGSKFLRRFYYGSDYGPRESSTELLAWSKGMLEQAVVSGFEVVTKRVKYMPSDTNPHGYDVKCDLDVEMAVDLIKERENYDTIFLFSGDGDLSYAMKYLHDEYGKECFVFGARGHIGREIVDAKNERIVRDILFAEDFEYRLSLQRRFNR
ncbi:MAG TPA: NYN domain-containing protein [Candidatus Saccharimonadales bacterium]